MVIKHKEADEQYGIELHNLNLVLRESAKEGTHVDGSHHEYDVEIVWICRTCGDTQIAKPLP